MIMILTGKAKEDFLDYCYKKHQKSRVFIQGIRDTYLNALIIEWLDSVGIIINITYSMGVFNYNILGKYPFYRADLFKTRQEATKQAIIKANKIYNETKS